MTRYTVKGFDKYGNEVMEVIELQHPLNGFWWTVRMWLGRLFSGAKRGKCGSGQAAS